MRLSISISKCHFQSENLKSVSFLFNCKVLKFLVRSSALLVYLTKTRLSHRRKCFDSDEKESTFFTFLSIFFSAVAVAVITTRASHQLRRQQCARLPQKRTHTHTHARTERERERLLTGFFFPTNFFKVVRVQVNEMVSPRARFFCSELLLICARKRNRLVVPALWRNGREPLKKYFDNPVSGGGSRSNFIGCCLSSSSVSHFSRGRWHIGPTR